jgi:ElaB/YqjD/DUF883 family membrane-anchored ribosome-binding protein
MARAATRARRRLFAEEPSLREELEQKKLAEEITRLKDGVDDLLDRATEQGRASVDAAVAAIQKRPVASIATAFFTGMLISALLARR